MTDKQWEPPEALVKNVRQALAEEIPDIGVLRRDDQMFAARAALLASPLGECVAVLRDVQKLLLKCGPLTIEGMRVGHALSALLDQLDPQEPADENA